MRKLLKILTFSALSLLWIGISTIVFWFFNRDIFVGSWLVLIISIAFPRLIYVLVLTAGVLFIFSKIVSNLSTSKTVFILLFSTILLFVLIFPKKVLILPFIPVILEPIKVSYDYYPADFEGGDEGIGLEIKTSKNLNQIESFYVEKDLFKENWLSKKREAEDGYIVPDSTTNLKGFNISAQIVHGEDDIYRIYFSDY